jgi:hypothetical protein
MTRLFVQRQLLSGPMVLCTYVQAFPGSNDVDLLRQPMHTDFTQSMLRESEQPPTKPHMDGTTISCQIYQLW